MRILLLLSALMIFSSVGHSQEKEAIPTACEGVVQQVSKDWLGCYEAAEPESFVWLLASMNLGTEAFYNGDHETAAQYYRNTIIEGKSVGSDIVFHANRGSTFFRTGDHELAKLDVDRAWQLIEDDHFGDPEAPGVDVPDPLKFYVLSRILEPLHTVSPDVSKPALDLFMQLDPGDLQNQANRAAVLHDVGQTELALVESAAVLSTMPDDPQLQNNHCVMLNSAGRSEEALTYCQNAVLAVPEIAAVHNSIAEVYAKLGRCDQAEVEQKIAHKLEPSTARYENSIECIAAD